MTPQQFTAPAGLSHGSLRGALVHILSAETIGLIGAVALGVVVVLSQPELAGKVQSLFNSLRFGTPDPQEVLSLLPTQLIVRGSTSVVRE